MVRPIEAIDNLAKTLAAEKVNSIQKAAPDMEQREFSKQVQNKEAEKREKAKPSGKTDEVIIQGEHQKKDDGQKKKKDEKERKEKRSETHLDLKA